MRFVLWTLLIFSSAGNAWACAAQQWFLRGTARPELAALQTEITRTTGLVVSRTEEIIRTPTRTEWWVLLTLPESAAPSAEQAHAIRRWQNEVLRNFPDDDFYCSPIHYPPGAVTGNN